MSDAMKRLYRSRQQRMIGGVCGGLGVYLNVDPTLVRVVFVLGMFLGYPGFFALVYLALLILIPEEPEVIHATGAGSSDSLSEELA